MPSKRSKPLNQPAEPALETLERAYQELVLFAETARGFQLALATYDHPQRREALLERLPRDPALAQVYVSRLDLSQAPEERHLLQRLERHLQATVVPQGQGHLVMVVGLESTLDYFPGRQKDGLAMLENANAQRDSFVQKCPVPAVLWLSVMATSAFGQHAPDLWHWRAATFDFTGSPESRQEFEQALTSLPLVETDALSQTRKRERIAMLQDLLLQLQYGQAADSPSVLARRGNLLNELGLVHAALGEPRRAIEYFEQRLAIAREIGDRRGVGIALGNLGNAYARLGEPRRAIEYYEQVLAIARQIGNRRDEGSTLGNLGLARADLGEPRRAIEYYEQHLGIAREIGDRWGEGAALGNLGIAYARLGEPRRAIEHYEQYLKIAREIGDRRGQGNALGNLGNAYARLGEPRRAIEYYEERLAIARQIGDRHGEGNALGSLGVAYADLGEPRRAIEYYEQCLAIARQISNRQGEAKTNWNVGIQYAKEGDLARAVELMQVYVDYAREIGHAEVEKRAAVVDKLRARLAEQQTADSDPPQPAPEA